MNYLTFDAYEQAVANNNYPGCGHNMVYPAMGLAGESGELADKIKKHWRNYNAGVQEIVSDANVPVTEGMAGDTLTDIQRDQVLKELGDVLWYCGALARELKSSLAEVAQINIAKLEDRAERGVIKSEGDNR